MKTYRRLILPVDGSAASTRGVAFAADLARSEGSEVAVCTVLDESAVMLPIAEGALVNPVPVIEAMELATAGYLATAQSALHNAGVVASGTLLRGSPAAEIHAFARHEQGDAIVIGTSGRRGFERMMMGSVTTALLCIADIPVITVHANDTLMPGPLLVAIDASAASAAALQCAIDRACATGGRLHLLHVFEESKIDRLSAAVGLTSADARRQALTDAEDALDEAADYVRTAGVPFTTELVRGAAVESILTAIEHHDAGAVAMGTHGRGALERFLIGSVADGVIRNARVPVYVVHRRSANVARPGLVRHDSTSREALTL